MKKNTRFLLLTIALFMTAAFLFAGGQKETEPAGRLSEEETGEAAGNSEAPDWLVEDTDEHITIIDGYGNRVTIEKPVTSVISQGMGAFFSAVRALGAEELVAASTEYVSRNKTFFPVISRMPPISTADAVDNEMIITLDPDFIQTGPFWIPYFSDVVTSEIPLVLLDFNSTTDYRILGAILDRKEEAEAFINWIDSYIVVIDERIADLPVDEYQDVFIYYGGSYGQSSPPPYGTFGKDNSLRNKLITRAGGRSLSRDIAGDWITVDPEWVIEQNPPLIVRTCYIINEHPELGYNVTDDSEARRLMNSILTEQPAFEGSGAVTDRKVYMIYGDLIQDSWFISLVYMAKWFHPDLFEDLDPVKMHQEYITRFQRLDYDVTTQGLFTYSAD